MMPFDTKTQWQQIGQELLTIARFGIVGVIATGVHILVVWILLSKTALSPLIANTLAFMTAFGFSFSGHYFWTFQNPGDLGRAVRRFLFISVIGFVVNTVVLTAMLHAGWLSPFVSVVFSLVVVPIVTFVSSRLRGFSPHRLG
jgi:putative flippase GtrA